MLGMFSALFDVCVEFTMTRSPSFDSIEIYFVFINLKIHLSKTMSAGGIFESQIS